MNGPQNSIGSHPESSEESWRRIRAALRDREEHAPDGGDLLGPIADAVEVLRRLARIEWERGVSALRAYRGRTPAEVGEAVLLGTLAIAGGVFLVRGVTGGLARLLGAEWAGNLVGGVVILGGALLFATVHRRSGGE